MIEINLLPEELRQKEHHKVAAAPFDLKKLDPNILGIGAIIFAIGLLLTAHLYLGAAAILKSASLKRADVRWKRMEADRKVLEVFKKNYAFLFNDQDNISGLINNRLLWSKKLNTLSLLLSSGMWFKELLLNGVELSIKGSVVSFTKEEMNLINKYIDSLKSDQDFMKDFSSVALGGVERKQIAGFEIFDFTLTLSGKKK